LLIPQAKELFHPAAAKTLEKRPSNAVTDEHHVESAQFDFTNSIAEMEQHSNNATPTTSELVGGIDMSVFAKDAVKLSDEVVQRESRKVAFRIARATPTKVIPQETARAARDEVLHEVRLGTGKLFFDGEVEKALARVGANALIDEGVVVAQFNKEAQRLIEAAVGVAMEAAFAEANVLVVAMEKSTTTTETGGVKEGEEMAEDMKSGGPAQERVTGFNGVVAMQSKGETISSKDESKPVELAETKEENTSKQEAPFFDMPVSTDQPWRLSSSADSSSRDEVPKQQQPAFVFGSQHPGSDSFVVPSPFSQQQQQQPSNPFSNLSFDLSPASRKIAKSERAKKRPEARAGGGDGVLRVSLPTRGESSLHDSASPSHSFNSSGFGSLFGTSQQPSQSLPTSPTHSHNNPSTTLFSTPTTMSHSMPTSPFPVSHPVAVFGASVPSNEVMFSAGTGGVTKHCIKEDPLTQLTSTSEMATRASECVVAENNKNDNNNDELEGEKKKPFELISLSQNPANNVFSTTSSQSQSPSLFASLPSLSGSSSMYNFKESAAAQNSLTSGSLSFPSTVAGLDAGSMASGFGGGMSRKSFYYLSLGLIIFFFSIASFSLVAISFALDSDPSDEMTQSSSAAVPFPTFSDPNMFTFGATNFTDYNQQQQLKKDEFSFGVGSNNDDKVVFTFGSARGGEFKFGANAQQMFAVDAGQGAPTEFANNFVRDYLQTQQQQNNNNNIPPQTRVDGRNYIEHKADFDKPPKLSPQAALGVILRSLANLTLLNLTRVNFKVWFYLLCFVCFYSLLHFGFCFKKIRICLLFSRLSPQVDSDVIDALASCKRLKKLQILQKDGFCTRAHPDQPSALSLAPLQCLADLGVLSVTSDVYDIILVDLNLRFGCCRRRFCPCCCCFCCCCCCCGCCCCCCCLSNFASFFPSHS
jgi:hypothetical protein